MASFLHPKPHSNSTIFKEVLMIRSLCTIQRCLPSAQWPQRRHLPQIGRLIIHRPSNPRQRSQRRSSPRRRGPPHHPPRRSNRRGRPRRRRWPRTRSPTLVASSRDRRRAHGFSRVLKLRRGLMPHRLPARLERRAQRRCRSISTRQRRST